MSQENVEIVRAAIDASDADSLVGGFFKHRDLKLDRECLDD